MVSRRKFCTILSGAFAAAAAPVYSNTPGLLRNAGDIRVIATQGESKGDVMANMLAQKIIKSTGKSNIDTIQYFEDSQKNIDDVLLKICDNQKINDIKPDNFKLVIYKVNKNSGGYRLQKITC